MTSQHARLSPSSSYRWMNCTASVAEIERRIKLGLISEDRTSEPAAQGTAAHELRALCLDLGLEPHQFIGATFKADGFTFVVDDEMADALQPGLDWIRERADSPMIETRVSLDPWLPGQFGTLDCGFIWYFAGRCILVINDLKYGFYNVPPTTPQLKIYALGAWKALGYPEIDAVLLIIDQPRAGGIKPHEMPFLDLYEFADTVAAAGERILSGDVEFNPSPPTCKFCPVGDSEAGCPAKDNSILDLFDEAFDEDPPAFADADFLDPARRWHILSHRSAITEWLNRLYAASISAARAGYPDPGSVFVVGKEGDRAYIDKGAAEAILVDAVGVDAYTAPAIIGPAAAEKLLKPGKRKKGNPAAWAALQELFVRSPGKPGLAPEGSTRPRALSLEDAFDEEPETPET